ncbi:hypothetical protein [Cryobacterium sp. Hz9]|uniref:hypothetical protein n=1 Tax=Cryobacterium sp. Hz9 TaxID=1259167 RepID=UPI00106C7E4E|nr:hypothetical protein [Cryobacterium sp. Hz9]TFB66149.1 hypothetical protein E3N85_09885 [Cryobacterium sp. Hz9]
MEDVSGRDAETSGMRPAKLSFLITLAMLGLAAILVGLVIGLNEAPWGFVIAGVGLVLGIASTIALVMFHHAH